MMEITEEAWRAEGTRRFGADESKWIFRCPSCRREMSLERARLLPADQVARLRAGKWSVESECVGRYLSIGCDWAAYGLLAGPVFVLRDGKRTPVFEFGGSFGSPFGEARG